MLLVKLRSGLGNNLFQYAAVRLVAEKKDIVFCYLPLRGLDYYKRKIRKQVSRFIRGDNREVAKQTAQRDISAYFKLDRFNNIKQFFFRMAWWIVPGKYKKKYIVRRKDYKSDVAFEIYDEDIYKVDSWTEIVGSFQSNKYLENQHEKLIKWFSLKKKYRKQLKKIEESMPVSADLRCCVHIRRGDYLVTDKGLARGNQGWVLPLEYYAKAFDSLPDNLFYIFVTDSPDYVKDNINFPDSKYITISSSEIIDMFIFTICKYNVIANSTFSWWGALLNNIEGRRVIAPEYHIGWTKKVWLPWSMMYSVDGWEYIDVLELVE